MKKSLDSIFDDKRILAIASLFISVIVWLVVGVVDVTEVDSYIHDVPVNINQQSQTLADRNLSVIVDSETHVSVKLRGPRTLLGSIKMEDIVVTPSFNAVTAAGTYDLALSVTSTSNIQSIKDVQVVSISPSTVKLRFDSMSTRTFTIDPIVQGLSTTPEYMSDPEKVNPPRVTITGPEADLLRIAKAVISVDLNDPLTRPLSRDLPIQLLDAQGNELDTDNKHLVMDQTEAQLYVNVRRLKTLPIIVGFTNTPTNFPLDELESVMNLSDFSVTVAGPVDTTDNYTELTLGHIDIRDLTIDNNVFSFPVNLPTEAFTNVDNINNVLVSFVTQDWDTQSYNVPLQETDMTNVPISYNVKLLTTSLSNVVLVGDTGVMEDLTSEDIVVTINLAERALHTGQYDYPVKISVPTKGLVWATGEYSAIIQVTER